MQAQTQCTLCKENIYVSDLTKLRYSIWVITLAGPAPWAVSRSRMWGFLSWDVASISAVCPNWPTSWLSLEFWSSRGKLAHHDYLWQHHDYLYNFGREGSWREHHLPFSIEWAARQTPAPPTPGVQRCKFAETNLQVFSQDFVWFQK